MSYNEFLHKEYELCFEQLRFYDSRHSDTFKYLFTLSSSAAAALFALFKFFQQTPKEFFVLQTLLTSIVFISTLVLFLSMVRNRLYFVVVARQINAIRKFLLDNEAKEFTNNQLYTSTATEAFKFFSFHTLQLFGGGVLSSFFAGITAYGVYPALGKIPCILAAIGTFTLVLLAEIVGGGLYLKKKDKKSTEKINEHKKRQSPEPQL